MKYRILCQSLALGCVFPSRPVPGLPRRQRQRRIGLGRRPRCGRGISTAGPCVRQCWHEALEGSELFTPKKICTNLWWLPIRILATKTAVYQVRGQRSLRLGKCRTARQRRMLGVSVQRGCSANSQCKEWTKVKNCVRHSSMFYTSLLGILDISVLPWSCCKSP